VISGHGFCVIQIVYGISLIVKAGGTSAARIPWAGLILLFHQGVPAIEMIHAPKALEYGKGIERTK
jgi:hypothetical protein